MAISTGDIRTDALDDLQARVENRETLTLTLPNLCFIFGINYELGDADIADNFQDMCDYLSTQSWLVDSSMVLYTNWYNQTVFITHTPIVTPSTTYSSG